ncbi:sugar phosphate isomerase/epimerase family protein [Streptomyces sp. NPDC050121]|uniref:sugar phosphate isomerase/epimerase family protein n=1 Tax=Streptomyces sp. NPDC050121 TaxID=3365601 RepID=UPI00378B052B
MTYSVQLYSVRNALETDFEGTIRQLAEIGYRRVEPCAFETRTEELAAAFAEHDITAPTGHTLLIPIDAPADIAADIPAETPPDQDEIFSAARRLGIGAVVHPLVPPQRWQDIEAIRDTAARLNAAAAKGADYGVRVGYHNHDWEISSKIRGATALEVLADLLDPELVLEVDTYWAAVGGEDPARLLERLGERVIAIHIKDGPATKDTAAQLPAGQGEIDVWGIIEAAKHLEVGIVEFDDYAGDIFEGVASSLRYLEAGPGADRTKGGAR